MQIFPAESYIDNLMGSKGGLKADNYGTIS